MTTNISSREITYQLNGDDFTGYYAYDDSTSESRPGILIVHEWWGHNDYVRRRAEQIAAQGYAALALDMYGAGKLADNPTDAEALMNATFAAPNLIPDRFDAAYQVLQQQSETDATQIGAMGYCFGGAVVLNMARAGKKLGAVASFHGLLDTEQPMQANVFDGKIAAFTGADDPMVTPEIVADFKQEMNVANVDYSVKSYPDTLHGFTNPQATARGEKFGFPLRYNQQADTDSWQRTLDLFASVFN